MSIRPMIPEEVAETSFEDMDTTFTRDVTQKKQSNGQLSPLLRQQHLNGLVPTPSSTTSSNGTVFSNTKDRYGSNNRTDEEEEDEEDEDFLDDFQEFRNRKDDFDDALQSYFKSQEPPAYRKESTDRIMNAKMFDLATDFGKRLNMGAGNTRKHKSLKQPRSMMNLNTHSQSGGAILSNGMPNSISIGDMRVKSNGTVRFKKSMPTLSSFNPTINEEEEDDEEEDENEDDATFRGGKTHHGVDYLHNFMEAGEEDNDDEFMFDESLIQPQFLNKPQEASPLKLSPSDYDIIRDDTLLTPRLHKRHKEWNNRLQLDSFKETMASKTRGKSNKSRTAASRIRTIKQEIDHNTPIKNGRMYYNPQTMKWEGNEQILDKFRKLESIDKKPVLIKTKSQLNNRNSHSFEDISRSAAEKNLRLKQRKSFTNGKIVGKMMFDEENLRWVSIHGNEEDPFAGIADVASTKQNSPNGTLKGRQNLSPFHRSQSQLLPSTSAGVDRLNSQATTRYHSVGLINSSETKSFDPAFQLNSKMLEKFCHEENRWNRKVGGWFILGNKDSKSATLRDLGKAQKRNSYMFEIRNMVINSTRD